MTPADKARIESIMAASVLFLSTRARVHRRLFITEKLQKTLRNQSNVTARFCPRKGCQIRHLIEGKKHTMGTLT
jgi:hypothetical protein